MFELEVDPKVRLLIVKKKKMICAITTIFKGMQKSIYNIET